MDPEGILQRLLRLPPEQALSLVEGELYRRDFGAFARAAWPFFQPHRKFVWIWSHDAIAEALHAVTDGDIIRLLVNIPPRMTKSFMVSVAFPAWVWLRKPSTQFLCISAIENVMLRDAQAMRDLVASPWYQTTFRPQWRIDKAQDAKSFFRNTAKGQRISQTTGTRRTGVDSDIIIIDDPHDVQQAIRSTHQIEKDVEDLSTITTRKNDQNDPMIVIMQRLSERDFSGDCLEAGGWVHICVPNEWDGERRRVTIDLGGGRERLICEDPRKEQGELLCEERIDRRRIEELKRYLQPVGYAAQYQQCPAPPEGIIFQKETWDETFWIAETLPKRFDYLIGSWDFTFTKSADSDYVVGQTWGVSAAHAYLLAQVRRKMEFTECLAAMKDRQQHCMAEWGMLPRMVVVEAKANGPKIVEAMSREIPGIKAYNPQGETKEGRARAVQPYFQARQVHLPDPRRFDWVKKDLLPELRFFPKWRRDDQVDALTQALLHVFGQMGLWSAA